MKVVILAGGYGTRISEESEFKPKPMIEIGDKPILWHIMKIYSSYGFHDFIICLGYKGNVIKQWFHDYYLYTSREITFDLKNNGIEMTNHQVEPWRVVLVETGLDTMTGGRVKRIQPYIGKETFLMTYGDGLSDVNLHDLVQFHRKQGKLATLTAIQPEGRFGAITLEHDLITKFGEKQDNVDYWVNSGFFVLDPEIFDLIQGDQTIWEREPLETLAERRQLAAFRHEGFWQPMDTLRDKNHLEQLLRKNQAPWVRW